MVECTVLGTGQKDKKSHSPSEKIKTAKYAVSEKRVIPYAWSKSIRDRCLKEEKMAMIK